MKEYWINVYDRNVQSLTHYPSPSHADVGQSYYKKRLYRIHVKMKSFYIQSSGRAIKPLKPKYEPLGIHEKWEWI